MFLACFLNRSNVNRFHSNPRLPTRFYSNDPYDIALDAKGKLVVVGYAYADNLCDYSCFATVRYTDSGGLDPLFSTDGIVTSYFGYYDDYARAVAIDSFSKSRKVDKS
jgi:hypothetical protein